MLCVISSEILLNTEEATRKAFFQTGKRFGVKITDHLLETVEGKSIMEAYGVLCPNGQRENCEHYHLDLLIGSNGLFGIADGVYRLLRELVEKEYFRGVYVGDRILQRGLENLGLLGYFRFVLSRDGELYDEVLQNHLNRLGFMPGDVVYIGKSVSEIKTWGDLGALTILVTDKKKMKLNGVVPDYTVKKLSEVTELI